MRSRMLTASMLACFLAAGWHCAGNHVSEAAVRSHDDVAPASISDSLQNTKSDHKSPEYVTRNIEDLKPGDLVLAREEHGNSIEYKPIKKVFRRTSYHLRHLTFETKDGSQQKLETTDEHPFWSVTDRTWIDAGDLKPGSKVTSPTGTIQTLAKTSRTEHPEGIPVFNFKVDDFHTYYVGENTSSNPLLVHNADCGQRSTTDIIAEIRARGPAVQTPLSPLEAAKAELYKLEKQISGSSGAQDATWQGEHFTPVGLQSDGV